ncbi:hypothetical protein COU14_02160, partial [Candidatus Kaiserbacteria bacterium CG10_big_fil_rev_8_21_14_0_10_44_10]
QEEPEIEIINLQRFSDGEGNSVELSFNPETESVTVSGAGYVGLVFNQITSASGARYENTENDLLLWNKDDEVTIYKEDEVVFVGTVETMEDIQTPNISDNNPSEINSADPALYASSWVWSHTDLSSGERIASPNNDEFILSFDGNGFVSSQTDCNGLGGIYTVDGEVLSMGQFVSTLMYCEGSMEGVYGEQLVQVNSYTIEGNTLRLNLARDYGVMTFISQGE